MKTNRKTTPVTTHEGAPAKRINNESQLRRSVMSCMLWEKEFYEDGVSISERIKSLIPKVPAEVCSKIAIEARTKMNLRHVPLLIVREMARIASHKPFVASTLSTIIQRPDELAEFLAIYWKEGRQPLSAQVKKGLAKAFCKFDEYRLAKYNRDGMVKLKDVLFLCHAKPENKAQEKLWKRLINDELKTPDTWEVMLSAGKDKKKTFTDLIKADKLGGLALLRNLRNMIEAGVNRKVVCDALVSMKTDRILPYRFIAAAKYAPEYEPELEKAMFKNLDGDEKLKGKTILMVDTSGSMNAALSDKSELSRIDAACGLAMLLRETCEDVRIFTFNDKVSVIPPRRGFALRDAIGSAHGGTDIGKAVQKANKTGYDRLIVITDEQSHTAVSNPLKEKGYMINVASAEHGVGYGAWTHFDGFSESIIDYILEIEK